MTEETETAPAPVVTTNDELTMELRIGNGALQQKVIVTTLHDGVPVSTVEEWRFVPIVSYEVPPAPPERPIGMPPNV